MDEQKKNLPILLYHAIDPGGKKRERYAVGREEFEKQLEYLHKNDFATFTLDVFFKTERRNRESQRGRKEIVLSFDDGYLSDYTFSLPMLMRFGFKAVFFVTTGRIGTPDYVNWEQLKEMTEKGMSIQSHSVSHSFLSEMDEEQMAQELFESKDLIEKKLRAPAEYLSLPGGFGSPKVMETAKKIGFRAVCTSEPGLNPIHFGEEGFRVLNRFLITKQTSLKHFQAIVEGKSKTILACKGKNLFKTFGKNIIGSRRYYRLWAKYFKYLPRT